MDLEVGLTTARRLFAFAGFLLASFILMSCEATYHYYRVDDYETELSSGLVNFHMSYANVRRGEDVGNAMIDSSGSLWEVSLTYWPRCRKPYEVELTVDSVEFITLPGGTPRPLVRSRWSRGQSVYSTTISIGPLSLPENEYPDILLELVMSVKVRADGSLLDRHKYRIRCDRI